LVEEGRAVWQPEGGAGEGRKGSAQDGVRGGRLAVE